MDHVIVSWALVGFNILLLLVNFGGERFHLTLPTFFSSLCFCFLNISVEGFNTPILLVNFAGERFHPSWHPFFSSLCFCSGTSIVVQGNELISIRWSNEIPWYCSGIGEPLKRAMKFWSEFMDWPETLSEKETKSLSLIRFWSRLFFLKEVAGVFCAKPWVHSTGIFWRNCGRNPLRQTSPSKKLGRSLCVLITVLWW